MRLVNPRAEIRVAAGREGHLRGLAPLALWPANSLFVEGYLTTRGDAVAETYRMIRDAGFEVDGNPLSRSLAESRRERGAGGFRLSGGDGEILRPESRARRRASPRVTLDAFARGAARRSSARAAPIGACACSTARRRRACSVDGREVLLFAGSNYLDLAHHPEVVEAGVRATRELGCAAGGSRLINGNLRAARGARGGAREVPRRRRRARLRDRLHGERRADPGARRRGRRRRLRRARPRLDHRRLPALARGGARVPARRSRRARAGAARGRLRAPARAARARRRLQHGRRHRAARRGGGAGAALRRDRAARRRARDGHARRGRPRHAGALRRARGRRRPGRHARQGARLLRRLRGREPRCCASCWSTRRAASSSAARSRRGPVAAARARSRSCSASRGGASSSSATRSACARALAAHGISTAPSTTQIVPVVIGENARTMAVCERLLERGFYAQGIRYPSVPEGTARLRITPMATPRGRRDRRARAGGCARDRRRCRVASAACAGRRDAREHGRRGFFVTGTDTGVGKTLVACALAARAARARHRRRRDEADRDRRRSRRARSTRSRCARRRAASDALDHVCPQRFALPAAPTRRRRRRGAPRRPRRRAARLRRARGAPCLSRRRGRGRPARARGRGREHGGPGGRARASAAGGGAREPRHHQPHAAHAGGGGRAAASRSRAS